ncbi:MAG: LacI family DNA-binding transcriptional regulator [Eubacteriales bacterium]
MSNTIKDVAKAAKVSIATVSRVINKTTPVKAELEARVNLAIKELNFRPNSAARNLVTRKNRVVGVIVSDLSNSFTGEILNGIEEMCQNLKYDVLVASTGGNIQREIQCLESFEGKQVEGIVILPWTLHSETVEKINSISTYVVMVNRNNSKLNVPIIAIDNYKAAYQMTNYLISKGHQKIGLIRNSVDVDFFGLDQYRGYKQAMMDHGLEVDQRYVKYGDFSMENSYNIVKNFINDKDVPTAIFATSDIMAIGAINALRDSDYKVPEDVSVVGFNNVKMASLYRPRLTVIHQPLFAIGTVAVKMIANQKAYILTPESKVVIMPHKLIERESCSEVTKNIKKPPAPRMFGEDLME